MLGQSDMDENEIKILKTINGTKTTKNRFSKMVDFWEQSSLPKLSDLPNLGVNENKKYEMDASKFTCIALTFHGKSLWDILNMDKKFNNATAGFCTL